MKRFILLCAIASLFCTAAYGWSRREHAIVAKIAEKHLTPKAKEHLYKYMDRRSLVYYASYADDYKSILLLDLDWQPSNTGKKVTIPHTFTVDEQYRPLRSAKVGDKYVKNNIYYTDIWAKELKANHKKMKDSVRMTHLFQIIHAIGDMHCPVHVRYPHDNTSGQYNIFYGKKRKNYHTFWDGEFIGPSFSVRSFNDLADYFDICNEKQIEEICKGDIYDWGEEVARISVPIRAYKPNEVIDPLQFRVTYLGTAEELIRKAGYRLAKILNDIFE